MDLDISTAQGALTGERYRNSLRDDREVWLNGAKILILRDVSIFFNSAK